MPEDISGCHHQGQDGAITGIKWVEARCATNVTIHETATHNQKLYGSSVKSAKVKKHWYTLTNI